MAGTLNFERARFNMIEQQVRPWEVLDPRVLEVMAEVKREDFVPPQHRKLAFADLAIPLGHGEMMMRPVVEGRLLQALAVRPEDEVLEIGTGSGFIAACLARLGRQVWTVERHADLAERARARIGAAGIRNCQVEMAAVSASWQPGRRFDAIAVTGAVAEVPAAFTQWLKPGGRLFVVRGQSPVMEAVLLTRDEADHIDTRSLFETDLTYLHGFEPREEFRF
jgi:protein-L-isoaspartate(D-aspartate) O-methyltransferase